MPWHGLILKYLAVFRISFVIPGTEKELMRKCFTLMCHLSFNLSPFISKDVSLFFNLYGLSGTQYTYCITSKKGSYFWESFGNLFCSFLCKYYILVTQLDIFCSFTQQGRAREQYKGIEVLFPQSSQPFWGCGDQNSVCAAIGLLFLSLVPREFYQFPVGLCISCITCPFF